MKTLFKEDLFIVDTTEFSTDETFLRYLIKIRDLTAIAPYLFLSLP